MVGCVECVEFEIVLIGRQFVIASVRSATRPSSVRTECQTQTMLRPVGCGSVLPVPEMSDWCEGKERYQDGKLEVLYVSGPDPQKSLMAS